MKATTQDRAAGRSARNMSVVFVVLLYTMTLPNLSYAAVVGMWPEPGSMGFVQMGQNNHVNITFRDDNAVGGVILMGIGNLDPGRSDVYAPGTVVSANGVQCVNTGDDIVVWGFSFDAYGNILTALSRTFRICGVESVIWAPIGGPGGPISPIDNNPNAGGGLRIFPGWRYPDYWNTDVTRYVQVVAQLDPPPTDPGQPLNVYFQVFDVDDPSASVAPVDADPATPAEGTDNRKFVTEGDGFVIGGTLQSWYESAVSDTAGVAWLIFQVYPQPGNNYRVVGDTVAYPASRYYAAHPDAQGRLYRRNTGSPGTPAPAGIQTPMLTVWRYLHVERDSMAAVTGNQVTGTIPAGGIAQNSPDAGQSTVNIGLNLANSYPDQFDDANQFLGGTITIAGHGTFDVGSNTTRGGGLNDQVVVTGPALVPPDAVGAAFTLRDDDDIVMPRLPDCDLLASKFQLVYVQPNIFPTGFLFNGNLVVDQNVTFHLNLLNGNILTLCNSWRDVSNAPMFWLAQVVSAFQPETAHDFDSEALDGWLGATPVNPQNGKCYHCVVVFQETNRESWPTSPPNRDEQVTVVHELGHTFQCEDEDGDIMDPDAYYTDWFSPISRDRIRDALKPGNY